MHTYELTLLLAGKASAAKIKTASELVEKLVKVFKGKVTSKKDWGELELAGKLKGNTTGTFIFFELELDSSGAKGFNDKLRLEDSIDRYLLVKSKE